MRASIIWNAQNVDVFRSRNPSKHKETYPEDEYYSFKIDKNNFVVKALVNKRNEYCLFKIVFGEE